MKYLFLLLPLVFSACKGDSPASPPPRTPVPTVSLSSILLEGSVMGVPGKPQEVRVNGETAELTEGRWAYTLSLEPEVPKVVTIEMLVDGTVVESRRLSIADR